VRAYLGRTQRRLGVDLGEKAGEHGIGKRLSHDRRLERHGEVGISNVASHPVGRFACRDRQSPWAEAGSAVIMRAMAAGGLQQASRLVGREPECAAIHSLLANARAGTGGAMVVRGEAGIGKTALLDYARRGSIWTPASTSPQYEPPVPRPSAAAGGEEGEL
jgi:hypothetical protein